eukprot:TRINITY_DN2741_c0_g1_i1.p1 TRINITY_DN2741_c0_g1~~TRINITY_DN2741_c0_g1_i1.p1  ORF type:complete len:622 (+),score=167.99 TRINITY_DN2741_c0_g1_i1:493-2358(+)
MPVGAKNKKSIKMDIDDHILPFRFQLPESGIYPSLYSKKGKVRIVYYLKATCEWKKSIGKGTLEEKRFIVVGSILEESTDSCMKSDEIMKSYKMDNMFSKNSTFSAKIELVKDVTWPNDELIFDCDIVNGTGRKLSHVIIKIQQHWQYGSRSSVHKNDCMQYKFLKGFPLKKGGQFKKYLKVKMPRNRQVLPPTVSGNIVKLLYKVVIIFPITRMGKDPYITLPLRVSTVPMDVAYHMRDEVSIMSATDGAAEGSDGSMIDPNDDTIVNPAPSKKIDYGDDGWPPGYKEPLRDTADRAAESDTTEEEVIESLGAPALLAAVGAVGSAAINFEDQEIPESGWPPGFTPPSQKRKVEPANTPTNIFTNDYPPDYPPTENEGPTRDYPPTEPERPTKDYPPNQPERPVHTTNTNQDFNYPPKRTDSNPFSRDITNSGPPTMPERPAYQQEISGNNIGGAPPMPRRPSQAERPVMPIRSTQSERPIMPARPPMPARPGTVSNGGPPPMPARPTNDHMFGGASQPINNSGFSNTNPFARASSTSMASVPVVNDEEKVLLVRCGDNIEEIFLENDTFQNLVEEIVETFGRPETDISKIVKGSNGATVRRDIQVRKLIENEELVVEWK